MKTLFEPVFRPLFATLIGLGLLAAGGCSSSNTVPMKVQSDPLGAYVLYQKRQSSSDNNGDWVYLGKTPLNIQQSIDKNSLGSSGTLRLRVMKEGYSDQMRDWSGKDIENDLDSMGHLFWNPRLVPGNQ